MDILKKFEDIIREYELPGISNLEDEIFYAANNNLKRISLEIYGVIYHTMEKESDGVYIGILKINISKGNTKAKDVLYIQKSTSLEDLREFVRRVLSRYKID